MARAALNWTVRDLENKSEINKNTISRYESGREVLSGTINKLEKVLESAGITFIYEDETRGSGVLLSKDLSRRIGVTPGATAKAKATKRKAKAK
ncbi:MAG: helix-turn-helix transcriptional regulator [Rhizomicrobium sp.]